MDDAKEETGTTTRWWCGSEGTLPRGSEHDAVGCVVPSLSIGRTSLAKRGEGLPSSLLNNKTRSRNRISIAVDYGRKEEKWQNTK